MQPYLPQTRKAINELLIAHQKKQKTKVIRLLSEKLPIEYVRENLESLIQEIKQSS